MNALKALTMRCRPEKRAEESTSCFLDKVPRDGLVELFHDGELHAALLGLGQGVLVAARAHYAGQGVWGRPASTSSSWGCA